MVTVLAVVAASTTQRGCPPGPTLFTPPEPVAARAAFYLLRGLVYPLFLNGLLALVAVVMLQVSFGQLLAAGFSFGKNSACAAGLAVGTLCMGVGLYLV